MNVRPGQLHLHATAFYHVPLSNLTQLQLLAFLDQVLRLLLSAITYAIFFFSLFPRTGELTRHPSSMT